MQDLKKFNKNYAYILVMVDDFSRVAHAFPLRSKKPDEIISALRKVFGKHSTPNKIRSDNGGEFVGKKMQAFLKSNNVHFMSTKNYDTKASFAEILIKYIKRKLVKYMYSRQSYKWYDVLPKIIDAYNHSYHSSIKMRPADVNEQNESSLWKRLYLPPDGQERVKARLKPFKYALGDMVRVSHLRTKFSREYDQKWSDQLYIISKRFRRDGLPVYKLIDFDGQEEVDGTFYQEEIQKVRIDPDTVYKIEKVIKKETLNGKKMAYVKWLGWDSKYNSYVPLADLKRFKK